MTDSFGFGRQSTTDEVLEGFDLTGRRAVVTGASGGLGEETARALAAHGADVVLASRDGAKLEAAAQRIRDSGVPGTVTTQVVDLASLASVRAAAAELAAAYPAIHLLVLNAGVMAPPLARTAEGHELQFGTNHLGHFLLTLLLEPNLVAGAPARVVVLSSGGHRVSPVLWDDPDFEHTEYHNFTAYGQSKTANALFALELDRRLGDRGVHAWSVHPGVIMTELSRHLTAEDLQWMADRARASRGETGGDEAGGDEAAGDEAGGGPDLSAFEFKTVPQGAATSVWAATAPGLEAHGGAYLEDCSVAEASDDPARASGVQSWARDPEQAARLWDLSLRMVGLAG